MLDQDKTKEQLIAELHNLEKLVEARTAELTVLSNQLQQEIARHKITEAALQISERNYRTLVELSPYGIGIEQNGKVVFINASGMELLGAQSPDQIIGKSVMDLVHPDYREKVQDRIQSIINDKTQMPYIEEKLVRIDGQVIDVETGSSECMYNNALARQVIFHDITKRKAVNDALISSEEKFRSVFETANDANLTSDQHGIITSWNTAASRIYGYSAEEIVGQPVSKIIPKRFIASHNKHAQEVVSSSLLPTPHQTEDLTGLKKDGTEFPAELSMSVWRSSSGNMVTAIIRDITERKRAERNLRESEDRFRNLAESATDAIVLVNDAAKVIFWNDSAALIFGYSKDEAIGMPLKMIVGDFDSHSRSFNRIAELDRSFLSNKVFESWGIKNNGQIFPIEISVSFWKTQEGGLFSSIIRDITDRKQVELTLRRNEEQYRSVVETASDAIITTDLQGIIINWNRGAEQIYGYSADEIINKSFITLVPDTVTLSSQNDMLEFYAQQPNGIVFQNTSLPGKRKDGSEFYAEGCVSKWQTDEGIFVTAIIRDITERKLAEQGLIESENKFRIMAEAIPAAVFIYQGTQLVYSNPAAQILSGFSFEELQKMYFWDIVHPEFRKQTREWGLKRQTGEMLPSSYELKIIQKKGASRWVFFSSAIIEYQGRPAVLGAAIDITDRKQAEKSLRESEEKYRVTAEIIPIHLGATDQSYKFSLWNNYSETMFGYTREEALHKLSPLDIHETAAEAQQVVDIAIKDGIYDKDLRFRRKDGTLFPAHLIVVPDRDSEGNIKGLYGIAEDITARRKAENIVTQVDDCLLSLTPDPDSNIQYLVESAGKILGGDCSAYHSTRGSCLNIKAEWNVPAAHKKMYPQKGSHLFHFLSHCKAEPFILSNAGDVFNFSNESLSFHLPYKALLAAPVKTGTHIRGSLHVAYNQPRVFTKSELNALSILSKAIGIEEERKKVLSKLKRNQKQLGKSEKLLKQFSAKVLSIREEEKKNISSALHDEIGSMVVALSALLMLTKDEIIENNIDQALNNITKTETKLRQSIEKLTTTPKKGGLNLTLKGSSYYSV